MNVYAGFISQVEGMNEGVVPSLLKETNYARGINVTCRGGNVATRPGFALVSDKLPQGIFQGAGRWSLNSTDYLVGVSSGRVFVVRTDDASCVDLGVLLSVNQQCFFSQMDRYMVIQDGVSKAVVLTILGSAVIQISPDFVNLPPGSIMQYAHNRLHYVPTFVPNTSEPGRAYVISGDLFFPEEPQNALKYTEALYLNEGGAHTLPMEMGYVGGIGTIRNSQTGTGVGEVLVFGRNGVSAFDFSLPRSYWTTQPLSSVLFFGNGTVAPWSICNVNNDVVYRSLDGTRTIRYTAATTAGSSGALSNSPLSVEAGSFFRDESLYAQQFVSSSFVDNRLYMTAVGVDGSYFKGIVSLDTAVLTAMNQTAAPAYDGLWTGYKFAQTIGALRLGKPTQYVFTQGPRLLRMDPDATSDEGAPVESQLVTGSYAFADERGAQATFVRKQLDYTELWVSGLKRDTTIKVYYRPGGYPFWSLLGERTISVPTDSQYPQSRQRVRIALEENAEACDPVLRGKLYSAYDMQFAIVWTGCMTVERFRVSALVIPEDAPEVVDQGNGTALTPGGSSGIVLSDFSYSVGGN